MKKITFLALGICLMIYSCSSPKKQDFSPRVKIANGTIEGIQDTATGLQEYFGIPFAKPPVDNLRWKAPQPLENWKGILMTKKFGPRPMQTNVFGDMHFRSDSMSENCLYLNVWTPAKKGKKGLPVLVYFYGGGFVAGSSDEPRYDGASLAQKGIVVVTANYRLNIFGFFADPELSAESPYKASGNYGLLDQAAALKWVHQNIAAFGGDPDKVTIGGESAGSISVSELMASPLTKNMISGAIGESGAGITPTLPPVPLAEAEKIGAEFAKQIGYPTIKELRALSAKKLLDLYTKSKRFGFPICIDGYFLPKTLPEIYNAKEQAQIPLLVGWNSAEMNGMAFMAGKPYSKKNFIQRVKTVFPHNYEEILKTYPHQTEKEVELSATDLASDGFIVYSTWKWFDLQRKNSPQPVYRYLFDNPRPPLANSNLTPGLAGGVMKKDKNAPPTPKPLGAAHSQEIEYCLGNLYLSPSYAWRKVDYHVSDTMESYFANFIKTGNPNGKNLPEWPAAKPDDSHPSVMLIKPGSEAIKVKKDNRFLMLEKIYRKQ
ncbi:MAG: carboxylesterase family protein [Bacteroidales bacterium]|nr:carboxylesterase family protein [Bacteroidales bacterium]